MGNFFYGGVGLGGTYKRPGTDYVTSGPMRGLEKKLDPMARTHKQTDGHGASMTELAQSGRFSENPTCRTHLLSVCR